MPQIVVCALYKFVTLENFQTLRQPLHNVMEANQVRGTVLLADEGINGYDSRITSSYRQRVRLVT
jgi:UPF0176 protein